MLRKKSDLVDDVLDLFNTVRLVFVQMEVLQAFGNAVIDRRTFVEGRRGILEDHLDVADDFAVQALRDIAGDPDALVEDLAAGAGKQHSNKYAS